MNKWTVWVGGVEVNEYYLNEIEAHDVIKYWKDEGYDDAVMEEIK